MKRTRRDVPWTLTAAASAALAACACVCVCGCSGTGSAAEEGEKSAALEVVRGAADVLAEAGSSRAHTAMRMASGGTNVTISGEGGFDYGERVGELLLTLPVPGEPVTEVFAPGLLYMKNRGAGVPRDKWVRVDVTTVADGNLVTGGATDPITAAELLRGARSASDLGEAEVDGEPVRHYRGVADISAAAAAAASSRAASGQAGEQLAAAVAGQDSTGGFTRTEVPFDAYLDERGVLRKVCHRFSFAREGAETVEVASVVVLYGFGTPVEVAMPDEDEVYAGTVS